MSHHSRAQSNDITFVIAILAGVAAWTHRAQLVRFAYISLGVAACILLLKMSWQFLRRRHFTQLQNIDTMDGLDFEQYVATLLRANGFRKVSITEKYDLGVDIIAEKNGIRWGIQAKRHSGLVKANAVRQVVTGLKLYDCDRSMVITNSTYSAVARRLAHANNCVLVDRTGLKKLSQQRCIL
jgi:HJR/Mrr/RecB family endonuclease